MFLSFVVVSATLQQHYLPYLAAATVSGFHSFTNSPSSMSELPECGCSFDYQRLLVAPDLMSYGLIYAIAWPAWLDVYGYGPHF